MAEIRVRHVFIHVPWATLWKIIAAAAAVWLWRELVWLFLLLVIAVIIAVGLAPVMARLERAGLPRWLAAVLPVVVIVAVIISFLALTWNSLLTQAQDFSRQLSAVEAAVGRVVPTPILELLRRSGPSNVSAIASYAMSLGRATLGAFGAFVLAWIFVVYLLIEAGPTYRWVRGFVPEPLRPRFDRTAAEARDVAFGFIVGNVTTSTCAGVYFFTWLSLLGVPGALLLALLGFVFDFIPVLGFYLSCAPAMAMAATKSGTLALLMIPVYLSYDLIENYLIGPRIYGGRLNLSRLAVLVAFAVGATLGGVIGAVLAMPIAAVYPTIERLWLRDSFGDDVIEEHQAISAD